MVSREEMKEFCCRIRLPEEALEMLISMFPSEEDYHGIREIFRSQRGEKERFYHAGGERAQARRWFLFYYVAFGIEAGKIFRDKGYSSREYEDTMKDITLWCGKCLKKYGEYGIYQYDWLWRHVEGRLVRLGRLQFEEMSSEWRLPFSGGEIRRGDPVINVHIPEGSPLLLHECLSSFKRAREKLGAERKMICHSWLLFPGLKNLLGKDSNILRFQEMFDVVIINEEEREAEERIFGDLQDNPLIYPRLTSLQKKAADYLAEGKKIGTGIGCVRE